MDVSLKAAPETNLVQPGTILLFLATEQYIYQEDTHTHMHSYFYHVLLTVYIHTPLKHGSLHKLRKH